MTVQHNSISVTKTGIRAIQENGKTVIRIHKSMNNLFDKAGNLMSTHIRHFSDGTFEVIINRSCEECIDFRSFGNETICSKCSYVKGWLEDGCY